MPAGATHQALHTFENAHEAQVGAPALEPKPPRPGPYRGGWPTEGIYRMACDLGHFLAVFVLLPARVKRRNAALDKLPSHLCITSTLDIKYTENAPTYQRAPSLPVRAKSVADSVLAASVSPSLVSPRASLAHSFCVSQRPHSLNLKFTG